MLVLMLAGWVSGHVCIGKGRALDISVMRERITEEI
jgi:hypothetical protein